MMDDNQIIKNAKEGNLDAIKRVFTLSYSSLFTQAHMLLKDKQGAEDVVQECFAIIISKPELWDNIIDFRWYVGRAVHNLCMYKLRNQNTDLAKYKNYAQWFASRYETSLPEIFNKIDKAEAENKVQALLKNLAPRARQAIELVYMEGLSYSEASRLMGISKNSLKTHLKNSIGMMRKLIHLLALITLLWVH